MKKKLMITMEKGTGEKYTKIIIGNRHKIKLCTGEIINVLTDKRDKQWFVTEVETGLNLVPDSYYGFLCYDTEHDIYKEKNALETAKYCLNLIIQFKKKSFKEILENRIKHLNKEKINESVCKQNAKEL